MRNASLRVGRTFALTAALTVFAAIGVWSGVGRANGVPIGARGLVGNPGSTIVAPAPNRAARPPAAKPFARPASTEAVLYRFQGGSDGAIPRTGVVADATGALYGSTLVGGGASACSSPNGPGCGTIFKLTPTASGYTESVLYRFQGASDGSFADGPIRGKAGALFGTTQLGGTGSCTISGNTGCGTVWRLKPSPNGYTKSILHSFRGGNDGAQPIGQLLLDPSGALYGTTLYGGGGPCSTPSSPAGCGTVFKLTPSGNGYTESVLHRFQGGKRDGAIPYATLIADANGVLYGTTTEGAKLQGLCSSPSAPDGCGTVFALTPTASGYTETIIHKFQGAPNDGFIPLEGVTAGKNGVLYGATFFGGSGPSSGSGVVYKLTPSGGGYSERILYSFQCVGVNDGCGPTGVLLLKSGVLYGTTFVGGGNNFREYGTVFSVTLAGGGFAALYAFMGSPDGRVPSSPNLYADAAGAIYGTTLGGGTTPSGNCTKGCGTVWKVTP